MELRYLLRSDDPCAVACAVCGEPIGSDAIYADDDDERALRLLCGRCALAPGAVSHRRAWSHRERSCRRCGRRLYYTAISPHEYCTGASERQSRRERQRRPRGVKPGVCLGCEQPFTTTRVDSRYCSAACRQKAYRRRQAAL